MKKGIVVLCSKLQLINHFMKKRFDAIVAPEETKACKKAEALAKYVSAIADIRKEERQEIDFQYNMYKKLGLPEEEYRKRIVSLLESRSPHLVSKSIAVMWKNIEGWNNDY